VVAAGVGMNSGGTTGSASDGQWLGWW